MNLKIMNWKKKKVEVKEEVKEEVKIDYAKRDVDRVLFKINQIDKYLDFIKLISYKDIMGFNDFFYTSEDNMMYKINCEIKILKVGRIKNYCCYNIDNDIIIDIDKKFDALIIKIKDKSNNAMNDEFMKKLFDFEKEYKSIYTDFNETYEGNIIGF